MPRKKLPTNDSLGDGVCKKTPLTLTRNQHKDLEDAWIRHRRITGRVVKFTAYLREVLLAHAYGKELPACNGETVAEKKRAAMPFKGERAARRAAYQKRKAA